MRVLHSFNGTRGELADWSLTAVERVGELLDHRQAVRRAREMVAQVRQRDPLALAMVELERVAYS